MNTENRTLMKEAREALKDNWGMAIITYLVAGILTSVAWPIGLIIAGPISVGSAIYSLNLSQKKNAELSQIFDGFQKFEKALVAYLLMLLYIILWSLLLIVPGIIAALSYSQTYFILAENDSISGVEAMKKSTEMMKIYKWKYFCLCLRFTGWAILSIFTFGIGFLFLVPYMQISFAKFYKDIK